ncbi:MAG: 1-acyl-sn-glycerol-3-phosphate acyltransferase, partial [Candidatus Accumulibacter sp.]|nr:1-acyl-sn-glycerol-3-phosphate acyltransferase [Accumulibacter sp.]
MLKRLFARFFLRVTGITLRGEPVDGSAVLIAAPHTSNWDFFVMLSFAWMRGIDPKWIGKKELFKGPMGPIMRALGGVSVDRSNASGVADQLA